MFHHPFTPEDHRGETAKNNALIADFFTSAAKALTQDGRVILTLASTTYVALWRPEDAAKAAGFKQETVKAFDRRQFPGYRHVMTQANKSAGSTESDNGLSLIFRRA